MVISMAMQDLIIMTCGVCSDSRLQPAPNTGAFSTSNWAIYVKLAKHMTTWLISLREIENWTLRSKTMEVSYCEAADVSRREFDLPCNHATAKCIKTKRMKMPTITSAINISLINMYPNVSHAYPYYHYYPMGTHIIKTINTEPKPSQHRANTEWTPKNSKSTANQHHDCQAILLSAQESKNVLFWW